eukprot:165806-Chlamydomonas_euryale.AAC.3
MSFCTEASSSTTAPTLPNTYCSRHTRRLYAEMAWYGRGCSGTALTGHGGCQAGGGGGMCAEAPAGVAQVWGCEGLSGAQWCSAGW